MFDALVRGRDELKALGFTVIVELDSVAGKSSSGIITMSEKQTSREKRGQNMGTIISIGPLAFSTEGGQEKFGGDLKLGDRVGFKRYEGVYFPPYDDDHEDHAGYTSIDYSLLVVKLSDKDTKK